MQVQLTDILNLHHTNRRVSIDSITSFAGSVNSRRAYKEFCKNLFQIGVTAEMINQKENEIFEIFKAQNSAISGRIRNSLTVNETSNSPVEDQVKAFFC